MTREEKLAVLLIALVDINDSVDALIQRVEGGISEDDFGNLQEVSKHIKLALLETVNATTDDKEPYMDEILPLTDMANNVAMRVELNKVAGKGLKAVVRSYRKNQASAMTDLEECVRAAEFMRAVFCKQ